MKAFEKKGEMDASKGIGIGIGIALLVIGVIGIALPVLKDTTASLTNLSSTETLLLGITGVVLIAVFIGMLAKMTA